MSDYSGPLRGVELINLLKKVTVRRMMEIRRLPATFADRYIDENFPDYMPDEQDYIRQAFGTKIRKFDPKSKLTESFFNTAAHTAGCSNVMLAKYRGVEPQSMHGMLTRAYRRLGMPWLDRNVTNVWTWDILGAAEQIYNQMLEENPLLLDAWDVVELGQHLLKYATIEVTKDTNPETDAGSAALLPTSPKLPTQVRQTDDEEVIITRDTDKSMDNPLDFAAALAASKPKD